MPHDGTLPRGSERWLPALERAEEHAVERAEQRGITAPMILDALLNPRYVREGAKPHQTRYDGHTCSVVIDNRTGALVTAFYKKEHLNRGESDAPRTVRSV